MEIKINDVIRNKRRSLGISQEVLAESLGVTVQAVSKWETGLSYPDIVMLPKIAEYFEMSLDGLFFGSDRENVSDCALNGIPDDGKLRIVQCIGNKVLGQNEYRRDDKIGLIIPDTDKKEISFEVWGSVDIEGDVGGFVDAGAEVNCGDVGTYVDAGGGVNCGNVGAHVEAGGGVNCGNVDAHVEAGGGVNCGNVDTHVVAGGQVNCGNVGTDVQAGGDVKCGTVGGDVNAGDNVSCTSIGGNVNCGGNVIYINQ